MCVSLAPRCMTLAHLLGAIIAFPDHWHRPQAVLEGMGGRDASLHYTNMALRTPKLYRRPLAAYGWFSTSPCEAGATLLLGVSSLLRGSAYTCVECSCPARASSREWKWCPRSQSSLSICNILLQRRRRGLWYLRLRMLSILRTHEGEDVTPREGGKFCYALLHLSSKMMYSVTT